MNNDNIVTLNGKGLRVKEVEQIVKNDEIQVKIDDTCLDKISKTRDFLEKEASDRIVYGINTGFGPMASHIIGRDHLLELQTNLVRSHATGMGEMVDVDYVLAAMVIRLNTLLIGNSGISVDLVKHLELFINKRIIPVVPEHGAVGTSGDLVQLAHIALALIGEGEVWFDGKRQKTEKVLADLDIKPYQLKIKEGLALINGTSFMAAIVSLLALQAERLLNLSIHSGALALELVHGYNDSISEKISELRPHAGQQLIAKRLRSILSSSQLLRDRNGLHLDKNNNDDVSQISDGVQDVYSFRCQPQILGPIVDTINETIKTVEVEINSVTDNPIVDLDSKAFLHGGNFHGDYVSLAADKLKIALIKLSILSERRINFFLNSAVNKHFPPFLNLSKPGLTLGLQGLQFVATSTTAKNQTLAFPQYVHSISTNADNQDVVSMGTDSALITDQVVKNTLVVVAIELVTLAQATEFNGNKQKLSVMTKELYDNVRHYFAKVDDDRVMYNELDNLLQAIKQDNKFDLRF